MPWSDPDNSLRPGRYSDNNKNETQLKAWKTATDRYKEKNYNESVSAFFTYLADEVEGNVTYVPDGYQFNFELLQGSRRVFGSCDGHTIRAYAPLAHMDAPGTAAMRQVLELNYKLYYSYTAPPHRDSTQASGSSP